MTEKLGEALFALSARLKVSGFLEDNQNHATYEAVVSAFEALSAPVDDGPVEREPVAFMYQKPGQMTRFHPVKWSYEGWTETPLYPDTQAQRAPVDREAIARALYEHWIQEDCLNEYCEWENLPGKETWLARADAIMQLLTASAAYQAGRLAGIEESADALKAWSENMLSPKTNSVLEAASIDLRKLGEGS